MIEKKGGVERRNMKEDERECRHKTEREGEGAK